MSDLADIMKNFLIKAEQKLQRDMWAKFVTDEEAIDYFLEEENKETWIMEDLDWLIESFEEHRPKIADFVREFKKSRTIH